MRMACGSVWLVAEASRDHRLGQWWDVIAGAGAGCFVVVFVDVLSRVFSVRVILPHTRRCV